MSTAATPTVPLNFGRNGRTQPPASGQYVNQSSQMTQTDTPTMEHFNSVQPQSTSQPSAQQSSSQYQPPSPSQSQPPAQSQYQPPSPNQSQPQPPAQSQPSSQSSNPRLSQPAPAPAPEKLLQSHAQEKSQMISQRSQAISSKNAPLKVSTGKIESNRIIFDRPDSKMIESDNGPQVEFTIIPIRYNYGSEGNKRISRLLWEIDGISYRGLVSKVDKQGKINTALAIDLSSEHEYTSFVIRDAQVIELACAQVLFQNRGKLKQPKLTEEFAKNILADMVWRKVNKDTGEFDDKVSPKLFLKLYDLGQSANGGSSTKKTKFYIPFVNINSMTHEEEPVDWNILMDTTLTGKFLIWVKDLTFLNGKARIRMTLQQQTSTSPPKKNEEVNYQEDILDEVRSEEINNRNDFISAFNDLQEARSKPKEINESDKPNESDKSTTKALEYKSNQSTEANDYETLMNNQNKFSSAQVESLS